MGLIASASKAIRLLASRRYTSGDLTTAQEAFTRVLDISADEIYIQQNLLLIQLILMKKNIMYKNLQIICIKKRPLL